jgi:CBS domain-containing protein
MKTQGHARNLMKSPVRSVTEEASLGDVARTIAATQAGGVPVIDSEQRVLGFISEVDVMGALLRGVAEDALVPSLMTTPVITVNEFDTLDSVMDLLRRHRIHHLPVLREADVIRYLSEHVLTQPPAAG